VTDFAKQAVGAVVDVNLPGPGSRVRAGEPCGDIDSVKSVNDPIASVTGTVRAHVDGSYDFTPPSDPCVQVAVV